MLQLSNFLFSESLLLSLASEEQGAALEEVLESLKEDHRVSNWQELRDSILARPAFPISSNGKIIIRLYHGRTNSAQDLIIAVGRSIKGILFEELAERIHFIFVIAIPHALNHEYLRVMGSIARVCKDPTTLEKLLVTSSSQEFIEILSEKSKE